MAQLAFDHAAEETKQVYAVFRTEAVRIFRAKHQEALTTFAKIETNQRFGPNPSGCFAKDCIRLGRRLAQRNLAHTAAAKFQIRINAAGWNNDHRFGEFSVEALNRARLSLVRFNAEAGKINRHHVSGISM